MKSPALQRTGQLVLAVAIGITVGNHIKAARFRRAVDIGYHDGFYRGQRARGIFTRALGLS